MTDAPDAKRNRSLWLVAIGFALVGFLWFLYWLFIAQFHVYTDDAYVHGNAVMLTPQVGAGVKAIYADETDLVQAGQLIVELDRSDFELRVEELKKVLASSVREVAQLFQDVEAKRAQITLKEAQLCQAQLDVKHREPLVKTGAVSVEEFEIYQTTAAVAAASVVVAEKEFEGAKARIVGTTIETHPLVQNAVWNLRQAYLDLIRCQIWAPVTGFVASRTVQVGDRVKVGDTLLYIVPLGDIWVEANYKETALKHVRIGQPVSFTADLYGRSFTYHGTVVGLRPGSGNAFSLLPPENDSGNWIKIIQRVPVRITISPDDLLKRPLLLGLSMRVTIHIGDTSGKMPPEIPTFQPLYTTDIYSRQLEEMVALDPLIADIISSNSPR